MRRGEFRELQFPIDRERIVARLDIYAQGGMETELSPAAQQVSAHLSKSLKEHTEIQFDHAPELQDAFFEELDKLIERIVADYRAGQYETAAELELLTFAKKFGKIIN